MVKLVALVIDADNEPIYALGRSLWREAARRHGVPLYFLRADPRITDDRLYVDGDVLAARWLDGFAPRINNKTFQGMHYCLAHLEFDYLLRSNLSSFYRLDVLRQRLMHAPRQGYYAGAINRLPYEGSPGQFFEYVSGSGVVLSRDMIPTLLRARATLPDQYIDDVWMGVALQQAPRQPLPRCDFVDVSTLDADSLLRVSARLDAAEQAGDFHFRVKNEGPAGRLALDAAVFGMLCQRFLSAEALPPEPSSAVASPVLSAAPA